MGDKEIEALKQFINATHSTSDTGLWLVTKEQAKELLAEIGEREARKAPIKGQINDDISAYFSKDPQSRILGGRDLEEYKTPVGIVTQRAPLDITSFLYPLSLPVQAIEELYSLFKSAASEPHAKEMQISIWNLEKEAKDAVKKRHQEEEPTGIIKYIDPKTGKIRIIEQWREPKNIPDCCLGGRTGGSGEYFTSSEDERYGGRIDLGEVDPTYAFTKENIARVGVESMRNIRKAQYHTQRALSSFYKNNNGGNT